jgi:hypothetical protein
VKSIKEKNSVEKDDAVEFKRLILIINLKKRGA